MEADDETTEDEYCYWCGYYHHGDISSGGSPSRDCSDYDEHKKEIDDEQ